MTQEEKAQAYDEALERARKQKYDYQKEFDKTDKNSQLAEILRAGMSAIELAFPELAESEDERIRKEIIKFLRSPFVAENITDEKIDPWIAYLEKLKEQKDWAEELNTKFEEEQKPASSGSSEKPNNLLWSEEDEKIRRNLMSLLANMRGDRITEETYQKYYPWLKDHTVSIENANKFAKLEYERGVKDGLSRHWKPSEEQMGSLNYAYCELFKREDVGHNILGPLQNLIDTLSKL